MKGVVEDGSDDEERGEGEGGERTKQGCGLEMGIFVIWFGAQRKKRRSRESATNPGNRQPLPLSLPAISVASVRRRRCEAHARRLCHPLGTVRGSEKAQVGGRSTVELAIGLATCSGGFSSDHVAAWHGPGPLLFLRS